MNPFIDFDLVHEMTRILERNKEILCICEGAVPGTEIIGLLSYSRLKSSKNNFSLEEIKNSNCITYRSNKQRKYNNQLNLYKFKRLKLFLALIENFESLNRVSIDGLMSILSTDDAFRLLTCFGEDVRQYTYDVCPYCNGHLNALSNSMSQPFCGYIPNERGIYFECESCGLVVQSPSVHEDDTYKIYDEWDKMDFVESTNNPYTKDSVRCNFDKILPLLPEKVKSLDLGGGIGHFSKFLLSQYEEWEITHSDFEIKTEVDGNIKSRTLDFTKSLIGNQQYDLITAWEVIEHVPYHKLSYILTNIHRALTPGGFFIFSTPDYDSPLCKSFDFYGLCIPFHYLVFGEKWLKNYFQESKEFEIYDIKHCSDFLDDASNWYGYGTETSTSMAVRNTSKVLQSIFEMDDDHKIRNRLYSNGIGTEIIMSLRKI